MKSRKRLILKIVTVILFLDITMSLAYEGIHGFLLGSLGTLILVVLLTPVIYFIRKWYFEYKNRKGVIIKEHEVIKNNVEEQEKVELKHLVKLNIIFVIYSIINAMVATNLATWRGAARAQGEFVYIIVFPIYLILAVTTLVISYRHMHKKYMFRGVIALFLLPTFAFDMEWFGRYLIDSGASHIIVFLIVAFSTAFIFFSPAFTQLFNLLFKSDNQK